MTLDILYQISTYLNDEDFMFSFSILSREQIFQTRRKKINSLRSKDLSQEIINDLRLEGKNKKIN